MGMWKYGNSHTADNAVLGVVQAGECDFAKRPIGPHQSHATSMDLQMTYLIFVRISGRDGKEFVLLESLVDAMAGAALQKWLGV